MYLWAMCITVPSAALCQLWLKQRIVERRGQPATENRITTGRLRMRMPSPSVEVVTHGVAYLSADPYRTSCLLAGDNVTWQALTRQDISLKKSDTFSFLIRTIYRPTEWEKDDIIYILANLLSHIPKTAVVVCSFGGLELYLLLYLLMLLLLLLGEK